MRQKAVIVCLCISILIVSACKATQVASPEVETGHELTKIVQTIYSQITETAIAAKLSVTATITASVRPPTNTPIPPTNTPTFTITPVFTQTPTITNTSTLVPVSHCPLAEVLLETIPAGSTFQQDHWLAKQWRILNAGDCVWTTQYQIVYHDGVRFNQPLVKNFQHEVQPGDFITITFEFAAPQKLGNHKSWWMMRTNTGELFGNGPGDVPLYIEINVKKAKD
ncbi:MAG: hypothetical protein ISR58_07205 [Anaerolineales bacterium]|nr:hypothetical protein [Chloroflexota bacterium]MBL6980963.1 hypothetical protein [Anaerolineales bacterium]